MFGDPDQLASALRSGSAHYKVIARGVFRAEQTILDLGRVALQFTSESLARVAYHATQAGRVALLTWPRGTELPVVRGTQVRPGELMSFGPDVEGYHRSPGAIEHAALLFDADALQRAAVELAGQELAIGHGSLHRPADAAIARLQTLIGDAQRVARTMPQVFAEPEAARGLAQSLLHAALGAMLEREPQRELASHARRARIMARFESIVEEHAARPLYLPELCKLVGVPERTLRKCCQQHLGTAPHQYLILRRMHFVRQALLRSEGSSVTVTSIATRFGFWELGRFSTLYRSLFGELPSVTLRRLDRAEFA